jgi:uncharacterized membrane protein
LTRSRVPFIVAVSSAAGVAVSAYLTIAHYASPAILACSSRGLVNCERVTTSPESVILGVPVALMGLVWFAAMAVLASPPLWRVPSAIVRVGRVGLVVLGMTFVLWLLYAELFRIGAICLWCTVAHILAFVVFVLVVLNTSQEAQ